jgi:hypothetical protein
VTTDSEEEFTVASIVRSVNEDNKHTDVILVPFPPDGTEKTF